MKILYITTIGGTMVFFPQLIKELIDQGHTVDIAANITSSPVCDCYYEWGCKVYPLSCSRSPFDKRNIKAIGEIKKLVKENGYDIVHCHTPIAAACTRLACRGLRKKGVKVFYTAHGFHFYKGAPKKNWLVYYPVEKLCAHFTDVLITINQEDYALAQKKLKAKKVVYVPGVGIDLEKFGKPTISKPEKRRELGIPNDATVLLSVGELNENKNHKIIIQAMSLLEGKNIHYLIAGKGNTASLLSQQAEELRMADKVHLLGYRSDVAELYSASDVFCFPSKREGLGLASLEAMSFGLPILTSNVHGINDYSEYGITGYKFSPSDAEGFAEGIKKLTEEPETCSKMGDYNRKTIKKYSLQNVLPIMHALYNDVKEEIKP